MNAVKYIRGLPLSERVSRRTDKTGECWLWTGARVSGGYGAIKLRGKSTPAPRAAWEAASGPIPPGMHVLHRCDNPLCVRPDHLFLGTFLDNMADMAIKGRAPNGEVHKHHKLTWEAVRFIRSNLDTVGALEAARKFGVTEMTIHNVRTNRSWKHDPQK